MNVFRDQMCGSLHQQLLDVLLNDSDLRLQLRSLVGGDRASDNRSRYTAGTSKCLLGAHKHVWNILVLAEQRQMQQNLQWLSVGCHHDELAEASVERFGRFVGAASQLLVVYRLLDEIHDFRRQHGVGEWISFWIDFVGLQNRACKQNV